MPVIDIFGGLINSRFVIYSTTIPKLELHFYIAFVAQELHIPHFRKFAARSAAAMFSVQSTSRGV